MFVHTYECMCDDCCAARDDAEMSVLLSASCDIETDVEPSDDDDNWELSEAWQID